MFVVKSRVCQSAAALKEREVAKMDDKSAQREERKKRSEWGRSYYTVLEKSPAFESVPDSETPRKDYYENLVK